jgi:hypothetical protein
MLYPVSIRVHSRAFAVDLNSYVLISGLTSRLCAFAVQFYWR